MTQHTVVTSFSPEGFEKYGKDFLRSFREFWPNSVRLAIYTEGQSVLGNECVPIDDLEEWKWFEESLKFPIMRGQTPQGYNIQYDARMARKTFIQADAVKRFGGKVFWIDADVVTFAPVPETFLDEMLPDDKLSCYLGRDGWFYTESGFLGFNADHPGCAGFMEVYTGIFLNGFIFLHQQWHDCIAYDAVRLAGEPGLFHNLAANLPRGTMHPFISSPLGAYLDHKKGPRKAAGRSPASDLVILRSESYWNA
jgi:hypothetical protein